MFAGGPLIPAFAKVPGVEDANVRIRPLTVPGGIVGLSASRNFD